MNKSYSILNIWPTYDKYCAVQKAIYYLRVGLSQKVFAEDYPSHPWILNHVHEVPELLRQFCDVAQVVIFHKLI
jgi:hypothetical protein